MLTHPLLSWSKKKAHTKINALQALGQAIGTASVHAHCWSEKREKSAINKERGEH